MSFDEEAHRRHLVSRPARAGLVAMADAVARGARIVRVRRLGGGLGSATSAVDLRTRAGHPLHVVLKRYPAGDDTGSLEWERLTFARRLPVPSPEPLALDDAGAWFGTPALAMTRLPGRPYLNPSHLDLWLREIAGALAKIQSVDAEQASGALRRPHGTDTWTPPDDHDWGSLYERAIAAVEALLAERARAGKRVGKRDRAICHGDFHPGNMLFHRGRLSGIVDWSGTRIGPRSFDLSYCRTEVALLFGGDASDRLRGAYESMIGTTARDVVLWDLMCALGARRWSHTWLTAYREQGRTDLTLGHFRARLRAFTARALSEA